MNLPGAEEFCCHIFFLWIWLFLFFLALFSVVPFSKSRVWWILDSAVILLQGEVTGFRNCCQEVHLQLKCSSQHELQLHEPYILFPNSYIFLQHQQQQQQIIPQSTKLKFIAVNGLRGSITVWQEKVCEALKIICRLLNCREIWCPLFPSHVFYIAVVSGKLCVRNMSKCSSSTY